MPIPPMRAVPTRRQGVWIRGLAFLVTTMLMSAAVAAPSNVDQLAAQLLKHDDFRVRTQAALALGASAADSAVKPLCAGLDDKSTTVRAAAAAGLGKLGKGGDTCLAKRLKAETKVSVKTVIRQSLDKLRGASTVELTADTRYYIAIAGVTDENGREATEYDELVRKAMADAVSARRDIVLAPTGESPDESRKRLKNRTDIRGFYLTPKATTPKYSDGNLTVQFEIALFTYPTKVLKGMLPVKLTEQGVSSESRPREENLLRMAAGRAMEKFTTQMERIR